MSSRTFDLLADLVRLAKKYGPDEFARLSELLGDPKVVADLRVALDTVRKAAPPRREKPRADSGAGGPVQLDPLLERARTALMDQAAYPRVADLADEAQRLGARVPAAGFRTRAEAVRAMLMHLGRFTPEAQEKAILGLRVGAQKGALEQWSDIIMHRKGS